MFIGAHPDDETQVAGTLALMSKRGFDVHSYITTPGRGGKPNNAETSLSDDLVIEERKKEANAFAQAIGMTTYIYDNKTQFLENNEQDVLALVKYIRSVRPNIIIVQHSQDYHFEHRQTNSLVLQAIEIAMRSMLLEYGQKIKDCVILESDGLNVLGNPSIYIDITSTQELKKKAIAMAYGERLGDLARLDEGLSMARGGRIGVAYAECFQLVNPPWYRMTHGAAVALAEFIQSS
ncbi:MAG: hypothetical protein RL094_302 [Candidatus Parcubacteria bacterium]